jgi:hypothetical protein
MNTIFTVILRNIIFNKKPVKNKIELKIVIL